MQVTLNRIRRAAAAGALAVTSLALASPVAAQVPTSLTFFGDSFLDTGNGDFLAGQLLGMDLTPSPPYAPKRASNGPVWGEYLAAAFGRATDAKATVDGGRNFAVGTATTGFTGYMGTPIGMLSQYYQQSGPLDPTGLYVVFGGANDLLGTATLPSAQRTFAIQQSVGNLSFILSSLYAQGARNFLIPNLPDVGLAPVALGGPTSATLSAATVEFNQYLAQGLAGISAVMPSANFMSLNLYQLFNNILIDTARGSSAYGFTNTSAPCLFVLASCDGAVFADQLHPTTYAHQLIANAAYTRVVNGTDVAVVPEPATVVLTACGLLLCGIAARRKRAA